MSTRFLQKTVVRLGVYEHVFHHSRRLQIQIHLQLKWPCTARGGFSAQGKSQSWEQSKSKGEESGYGQVVAWPCLCGSFFGNCESCFSVMNIFKNSLGVSRCQCPCLQMSTRLIRFLQTMVVRLGLDWIIDEYYA